MIRGFSLTLFSSILLSSYKFFHKTLSPFEMYPSHHFFRSNTLFISRFFLFIRSSTFFLSWDLSLWKISDYILHIASCPSKAFNLYFSNFLYNHVSYPSNARLQTTGFITFFFSSLLILFVKSYPLLLNAFLAIIILLLISAVHVSSSELSDPK